MMALWCRGIRPGRVAGLLGLAGLTGLAGLVLPAPPTPLRAASDPIALDRAIQPILARLPSEADLRFVKTAILAYHKDDGDAGRAALAKVKDKIARKLVIWYAYRSGVSDASPQTIEKFRKANPLWPGRKLRKVAERALLLDGAGAGEVKAFFAAAPPETGAGKAALARAYLQTGNRAKARALVAAAWRDHTLDADVEKEIIAGLGKLLTADDHKWRINRTLMRDIRWRGGRKTRIARARRAAKFLSKAERRKVDARIAVYARSLRKAARLYARLPKSALKDWGVYFQKIQLLRRQKKDAAAERLLLKAPTDPRLITSPDDWWVERRVNAYRALYARNYRVAYKLVSNTGPLSVNPRNEALFMAGWIALRFLGEPVTAERHLRAFTKSADGPRTRSKSSYWLARALEKLGRKSEAQRHYKLAARHFNTFYGQLARQTLDANSTTIRIAAPPLPDQAAIERFQRRDAILALVIAKKADVANVMRVFLSFTRYRLEDPGESVLLAHLATSLGDTQMALRIAKTGLFRGQNLVNYAYPTHAMPKFKSLRPNPEMAMLYAIARQESEFNTLIHSGAGARGILQVMPITARHVCRQYKIRCRISALKSNPAYNAKLASAYIADRKDEFSGSYILTFAGYNAGPGRARYWIRKIGDPRDPRVDPIDWIELIHIKETREYVKKVMANLQVYRSRLGNPDKALRIRRDIARARRRAGN